jgi:hypothetical protein
MHYDVVKGCEHANIKEVGFVPHCCDQEGRQLLKNGNLTYNREGQVMVALAR